MRAVFITFILSFMPITCIGQADVVSIKMGAVEAVIRHTIQNYENYTEKYLKPPYTATHFAIYAEKDVGFKIDKPFLSRFSDISQPVIDFNEIKGSCESRYTSKGYYTQYWFKDSGKPLLPLKLIFYDVKISEDNTVDVIAYISYSADSCEVFKLYKVINNNGKWVVDKIVKKKTRCGDC